MLRAMSRAGPISPHHHPTLSSTVEGHPGHPGLPLGAAPMAWAPGRATAAGLGSGAWPDRDRFVLSAGHGSMLLYSLLHLTGYDVSSTT
jgi:transketolase